MTNELIPTDQTITALVKISNYALKSKYLPDSIKTIEQAVIITLKGIELGIPPMQAFSQITVINGKPSISAELMISLVYKNIPSAEINFKQNDDKICEIHARRSKENEFNVFRFTIEDANRAGLLQKPVWKQYPASMLRARCISIMCRAIFPDAIAGASYTPEELEPIETEKKVKIGNAIETSSRVVSSDEVKTMQEKTIEKKEQKQKEAKASESQINEIRNKLYRELGMTIQECVSFLFSAVGKKSILQLTESEADIVLKKIRELEMQKLATLK